MSLRTTTLIGNKTLTNHDSVTINFLKSQYTKWFICFFRSCVKRRSFTLIILGTDDIPDSFQRHLKREKENQF